VKLCIAEKPSVAKEIAKILGASRRMDGYFEGNGYWVSWTFGHLCTLKTPDDYDARLRWWKLGELPIIPQKFGIKLIDNDGSKKQFRVIENLIRNENCSELINCGDAGQEGELIQRWVYHKAGNTKPVKRLWISSLTEEAIKEGFQKLQDQSKYKHLYEAGSARAIGDWLLGINASRLYTLKYGSGKNVLSIGRVQTPTLAMIVQRHLEIINFVPKDFWEVKTLYRDVLFSYEKGRFFRKGKSRDNDGKNQRGRIYSSEFRKEKRKGICAKII
jgi:DNA topoisomerase-3